VDYILGVLSGYTWREHIDNYKSDPIVNKIFINWKMFLELFLKKCNFTSHGAEPSLTYHRPEKNDNAEFPERRDSKNIPKINSMYEGSPGKRESREYKVDEEIKRYLRHCAATLKINFQLKEEIQCYYDDEENLVYIATNDSNDEKKLSGFEGKQMSEFSAVLEHPLKGLLNCTDDYYSFSIWSGFQDRLFDAILLDATLSKDDMVEPLRRLKHNLVCPANLSKAKIHIIKSSTIDVPIQGLHAERKILYYLRSQKNNNDFFLDPLRLGGIRRPCFVCSALCFADMSKIRPGPCWVSTAGSKPKDIKEMFLILDAIRNEGNTTYITDNNEHLTMDYDTESCEGSECDQNTN